uniref:Uncharacterized protein n=1 Tax=Kalanchoe fedtschenkoi TaxID=63787 RepID=A0A7N0ZWU9_KALFE
MSDPPADEFQQSNPPVVTAERNDTTSIVVFSADEARGDQAALPPLPRKTRDLPNLAECHSCGLRVNTSNGKDKLRILDSEWRVVLLCRKCCRRAAHGEMCTYCLGEVGGEGERFKCGECRSCVHKDCLVMFSDSAPWSYFDWSSVDVCVDCWLPSRVRKMRDVQGGRRRVSGNYLGSGKKLMEFGVKGDLENGLEKRAQLVVKPQMAYEDREKSMRQTEYEDREKSKRQTAYKDKEKSLRKGLVEKVDVGKEKCGLVYVSSAELGQKRKGVDDAELAFQLHRVMNSSPRILRNLRPSSASQLVKRRAARNASSVRTSAAGKKNGDGGVGFNDAANKGFDAKDDRVEGVLKEGQGSCSNNSMDLESFTWKELDLPKPELKLSYVRRKNRSNVDGRPDRYMFKYSRKKSRLKGLVARKYTYLYDRSSYESETSSTAIVLHTTNESQKFPDNCILALPVSMGSKGSSRNKV